MKLCTVSTIAAVLVFFCFNSHAQILKYTNATNGALYSIAANASGTPLARVNGAATVSSPCATGFSSSGFSSTNNFSTALAAIEVTVTPSANATLNVTGFAVDARRSSSGPSYIRLAYSTNGGSTWINQGSNKSPNNGSCGQTTASTWNTSFTVAAPSQLKFRVYGFKASASGGVLQLLNLVVNGTVASTCPAPVLSINSTAVSCFGGGNGSATVNASGGVAPYAYSWSNGATTQSINNLSAGNYSATISNAGNCNAAVATITVTQPAALSSTVSIVNASCNADGQATVTVSGGTSPYSYSWNTVPIQTTATATSLNTGTYAVNLTDAHGCTTSKSVSIARKVPSSLSADHITSTSARLHWSPVASAASYNVQYRVASGGTWVNGSSSVDSLTVSGLQAGINYQFQVQTVCSDASTSSYSSPQNFNTPSLGVSCDTSLWSHVYHSYRLTVYNPCTTVTGTVDHLIYEADGDIHVRLHLDSAYAGMINSSNVSGQYGDLVVEPICVSNVTQSDAVSACQNFTNTVYIPNVGEHVSVTGSYVNDTQHGWNEIHPVTSITIISQRISEQEPNGTNEVSVYPNPASSVVNFSLSRLPSSPVFVTVMDGLGRTAAQFQLFDSQLLKYKTSYLPAGIYYYNVRQADRVLRSGTFEKR